MKEKVFRVSTKKDKNTYIVKIIDLLEPCDYGAAVYESIVLYPREYYGHTIIIVEASWHIQELSRLEQELM